MKLSWTVLLSAFLLIGITGAVAQDRDDRGNDARLQNVQWGYGNNGNNGDYQRGVQDGINSGRADANQGKVANLNTHPYYTNSNNQAYREGFAQGYRETYSQMRGGNNGYYGHGRNGVYSNNGTYNNGTYNNGTYNNGRNNNGYYDRNGNYHRRDHDHDRDDRRQHDRDHDRDRDHDHDRDDH